MFTKDLFRYLIRLYFLSLVFLFFLRTAFVLYHSGSIPQPSFVTILKTFGTGALFDSCVIASVLFLSWSLTIPYALIRKRRGSRFFYHTANILLAFVFLINLADIFYFNQYGLRLNTFAGEAANDPGKIIVTAWKIYPILRILIIYIFFLFLFLRSNKRIFNRNIPARNEPGSVKWGSITPITLFAFSFLWIGPPLWTLAEFSDSSVLNQASLNGVYTLIKSYDQQRIYSNDIPAYDLSNEKIAENDLLDSIVHENDSMLNGYYPTLRKSKTKGSFEKKNVVIIILESFGARFIGKLNEGKGLSPNFDRYTDSGMFFTRFRSNGPRTQNGIMSTVSGFPSILGVNMQRRKGTHEFQTLGNILLANGYETKFLHNGHADYDDMDKFMKQGGFRYQLDVNDYTKWKVKNEWGVSDEDLYEKAYDMIWNTNGKPVLSVFLTMSNHEPHDVPDDFRKQHPEIEKMDKKEATFYYSDFALGNFLDRCSKHPQYRNTIFVILADHGEAYSPVDNECKIFHIPCLILNSKHGIGTVEDDASQCDIPSMLLAELNYPGAYHFIGQDVFSKDHSPYAFMRAYGNDVYFCRDSIMLKYFFENRKAQFYYLDKHLYQRPADGVNENTKASMILYVQRYMQSISWIFRNGRYRFSN